MPGFDQVTLKASDESHIQRLYSSFDTFRNEEKDSSDLVFHCSDGKKLRVSQRFLAFSSTFLQKIIFSRTCSCCGGEPQTTLDLICPDFKSEPLSKIFELFNIGQVVITEDDKSLSKQVNEIADMLHIHLEWPSCSTEEFQEDTFVEDQGCALSEDSNDSVEVINIFEANDLHESNLFKCSTCDMEFTSRFALNRHKVEHGENSLASNFRNDDEDNETQNGSASKCNKEDYVGEWCPKCNELMFRKELDNHLKECDGSYVDPDAETDVERLSDDEDEPEGLTRTQDSPIPSTSTMSNPRSFSMKQKSNLRETHSLLSDSKNFQCHRCDKGFDTYFKLVSHLTSRHFYKKLAPFIKGNDKCFFCQKSFKKRPKLLYHMASAHKCNICGSESSIRLNFLIHIAKNHIPVLKNCVPPETFFYLMFVSQKRDLRQSSHDENINLNSCNL